MNNFFIPVGGWPSTIYNDFNHRINSSSISNDSSLNDVNKNSAFSETNFVDYLHNLYSGDLDYNRTLDLLNFEQAFNRDEAEKNRQFQKMMSDSSYQRAVVDLKKAGYNPALVVGLGGATTPTGSNAFSTSKNVVPSGTQMTSILNNLISSAFRLMSSVIPKVGSK